jgi:hypothetical protein
METPQKHEPTQMETTILGCEAVISQMVFQAMLMKPDSPEMQALGQSAHKTVLLLASQRNDIVGEA